MEMFEFRIFCSGVDTIDDSFLDRLHEAGCDDALVFFKDGYICLDFSREASNAEQALVSAVRDIEHSAIDAITERIEPDDLTSLSEIARRTGVTRASLQKYARGNSRVGADFPKPVANISRSRRELYSASEVISWMLEKHRVNLPSRTLELARAICVTNQALLVKKTRKNADVKRLASLLNF
jgi:transcriptional regulator with XRE-family HTH domain